VSAREEKKGGGEETGFAAMLAEYQTPMRRQMPRVGDEVTARIVAISSDSVFVDLGGKAEAVIDRAELLDDNEQLRVAIGDSVTARVVDTSGGSIVLRTKIARGADAANELAQAQEHRIPVEGTVVAAIKGGVEVDIAGVRGFCPVSQLDLRYVEDPATYVGKRLEFLITRYEAAGRGGKPNVVVSRRSLVEEEAKKRAAETRSTLAIGNIVSGVVTSIKEYGAFVDVGGLEGMIHITELGFDRVKHPSDVLKVGDQVEVAVTKIEPASGDKKERIGLSLKAMQEDPFEKAAAELVEGQRLSGEIARLEAFGAFVTLPHGAQGLIHVSELGSDRRVNHARDVVSVGQKVDVVVLGIDRERKRIALSMKQVAAKAEEEQVRTFRPQGGSMGTLADLLQPGSKPTKPSNKPGKRKA
jgi:small subunit ribosomal protein S1